VLKYALLPFHVKMISLHITPLYLSSCDYFYYMYSPKIKAADLVNYVFSRVVQKNMNIRLLHDYHFSA
jgi:hypothetical protein